MENLESTGNVLRKIALFTLIGFLVIVLAGPMLTLIGMLIPFALVGFLVWLPFHFLKIGRVGGWAAVRDTAKKGLLKIAAVPVWLASHIVYGALWLLRTAFGLVRFILGIVLPVLGGAFVGALLGLMGGIEYHDADVRIPAGALLGAAIGLLAGILRTRSKPVKPVVIRVEAPVVRHA